MFLQDLKIRLSGGSDPNSGIVEIKRNNIYGSVCDDQFGPNAAKVCILDPQYHKVKTYFA